MLVGVSILRSIRFLLPRACRRPRLVLVIIVKVSLFGDTCMSPAWSCLISTDMNDLNLVWLERDSDKFHFLATCACRLPGLV